MMRVDGVLDLALVAILVSLTAPLARAEVSVFALSTFETDHLLVEADDLETAISALRRAATRSTMKRRARGPKSSGRLPEPVADVGEHPSSSAGPPR